MAQPLIIFVKNKAIKDSVLISYILFTSIATTKKAFIRSFFLFL